MNWSVIYIVLFVVFPNYILFLVWKWTRILGLLTSGRLRTGCIFGWHCWLPCWVGEGTITVYSWTFGSKGKYFVSNILIP